MSYNIEFGGNRPITNQVMIDQSCLLYKFTAISFYQNTNTAIDSPEICDVSGEVLVGGKSFLRL